MPAFIPGIDLSHRFYEDVVRPLLAESFPDLPYAAALLGPGSETLGFDSEMSTDHDWGARVLIFLKEEDKHQREPITRFLSHRLPRTFADFPVDLPADPDEPRAHIMKSPVDGPVNHRVTLITLHDFVRIQLGYDLNQPLSMADWLTFPSHALGELTAGAVYYDGVGELTALRERLAWYPYDIWLYLLASGWQRIGQEEHLMPRAGFAGDELGSAIIGSRLVRDVMRLCFLLEKRYAPYAKWLGTAFKRLHCAEDLWPILWRAQQASTWPERAEALSQSYEFLAHMHNTLGLTRKLPEKVSPFYSRPFLVIQGDQFAQVLVEQITDSEVKQIASRRLIGNVDQWSDNTDIEGIGRARVRHLYE